MTNAEYIHSMSDEELEHWIDSWCGFDCEICSVSMSNCPYDSCYEPSLEWLKSTKED